MSDAGDHGRPQVPDRRKHYLRWKGPWQSWVWGCLALTHLLMCHLSSDSASCPPVQEWFVYSGNPLTHPDLVRPLQMSLPGTDGSVQQVADCSPDGRVQIPLETHFPELHRTSGQFSGPRGGPLFLTAEGGGSRTCVPACCWAPLRVSDSPSHHRQTRA